MAWRGDRVVARAAWWGAPDDDNPRTLDWLDFTDPDAAVALLRAAPLHTDYILEVPVGWRDLPEVRAAAEARIEVARRCGIRPLVERLQYAWTPAHGLPARPGRLHLRPEPDDAVIVEILQRIFVDVMDQGIRQDVDRLGVERAAEEELAFFKWLPGPRTWWRVAHTPTGELAGLTIPSRNHGGPRSASLASCRDSAATATATNCSLRAPTCSPMLARTASPQRPTPPIPRWSPPSPAPATPSRVTGSCSPTGRRGRPPRSARHAVTCPGRRRQP